MIEGIKKTQNENTLKLLEDSPFTFHLTGSRAFASNAYYSDWDFFVQDNEDDYEENPGPVRVWLNSKGFKLQNEPMYESSNTAFVYRLGGVHIQVVHDVKMKSLAQGILKQSGLMQANLSKNVTKKIWQAVFDALEIGYKSFDRAISV